MRWFWDLTGANNGNSHLYLLWSGFIPSMGLLSVVGGWWHKHNCAEDRCWRIGHHVTMEGSGLHVRRCRRHNGLRHSDR